MKYFEQFNKIDINATNFRDIFFRVLLTSITEEQLSIYTLNDYETIKDVSNAYYGSVDLWWTIAIVNNIYDINYDWVLTLEEINEICKEKTSTPEDFLILFDELTTKNDTKRTIKLIQRQFINQFISDFLAQFKNQTTITDFKDVGQRLISQMNQRMIDDNVFDNSECGSDNPKVLDLEATTDQLNIDLTWSLISNTDDWHKTCIILDDKAIDLIEPDEEEYTIVETSNGKHIIDVVLLNKYEGVIVNTTVVPSVAGRVWNNFADVAETLTCACKDDDNNFYVATDNGKIFRTDSFTTYTELTIATTDEIIDIKSTSGYIIAITEQQAFVCINGEDVFDLKPNLSNPYTSGYYSALISIPETDYIIFGVGNGRGRLYTAYIPSGSFINSGYMTYIDSHGWVSSGLAIDSENVLLIQGGDNTISIERIENVLSYPVSHITNIQNANNVVEGQIVFNEYTEKYFTLTSDYGTPQRLTLQKSDNVGYSWNSVLTLLDPIKPVLNWCGGNSLLIGGINTIQRSMNDGATFDEVETPDGEVLEFVKMDNGSVVAITNGTNNIYVSSAE